MTIRSNTALLLVLLSALAACGTTKTQKAKTEAEKTTKLRLRNFADDINKRVQKCAAEVRATTDDTGLRRTMIQWQISTLRQTQRSLRYPDARWTVLELWTGLVRIRSFLDTPESIALLGEGPHAIVKRHMDALRLRIERRSAGVLSDSQIAKINEAAEKLAVTNPLSDDELKRPGQTVNFRENKDALKVIANLPADLFSLGGGVKDTGLAISDVAAVADRGVDGIETMPQMIRWQTELLLMDLEENPSIKTVIANSTQVSAAVDRVSRTVETLPAEVGKTVTRVLKDLEKAQPELRATLKEGRGAVDEARGAIQDVGPLLDKAAEQGPWVERTVTEASSAGKAWEGAFHELNLMVNPPLDPDQPPPEPSPPFDMKDLANTAESTNKAAVELRATVADVREIIDGEGLDKRIDQVDSTTTKTLDLTSAHVAALIDRITWRAGLLIVLFFGLLAGYRIFASRITKA